MYWKRTYREKTYGGLHFLISRMSNMYYCIQITSLWPKTREGRNKTKVRKKVNDLLLCSNLKVTFLHPLNTIIFNIKINEWPRYKNNINKFSFKKLNKFIILRMYLSISSSSIHRDHRTPLLHGPPLAHFHQSYWFVMNSYYWVSYHIVILIK